MRTNATDRRSAQQRQSTTTKTQIRALRAELRNRIDGRDLVISEAIQEPAHRAAFGCEPLVGRVQGLFDAWNEAGTGWSLKTVKITNRSLLRSLFPNELARKQIATPAEAESYIGSDPIVIEFEHARHSPSLKRLNQLVALDPDTAGSWLIRQIESHVETWAEKRSVSDLRYGFLLRHPDGKRLAYGEAPLAFSDMTWNWQEVAEASDDLFSDEAGDGTEPIALRGFDRETGMKLLVCFYIRGGQVHVRVALDPAKIWRFRV